MSFPIPDGTMRIASFDFDGTLAEGTYPSPQLGPVIPLAKRALLFYADNGFEVVIHTARPASHGPAIRDWLERNGMGGLVYDIYFGKPRASVYFDDRAMRFPECFE